MSDQLNTRGGGNEDASFDSADMPTEKEGFDMDVWWEDRSLPQKILFGILFAIGGIGLLALFGLVVMLLWNWLMPEIFGLKQLSYWQAWGLLVLCSILFKNWGGGNNNGSVERKRKRQLRRYMREGKEPTGEDSTGSPEA
jgi:hypothetical protein